MMARDNPSRITNKSIIELFIIFHICCIICYTLNLYFVVVLNLYYHLFRMEVDLYYNYLIVDLNLNASQD